jgi:hypothetical protein
MKPHQWPMPVTVAVIVAAFLFAVNAWAGELNKSNSLTVDKDAITGSWIATCDISISSVERQIYSGRMLFEFLPQGAGSSTFIFDAFFQVDPAEPVWTDSNPGIYSVTAILRGHQVAVHAEVAFESIGPGDRLSCGSRIDPGTQPPAAGTTLFGANMVATIQQP